MSAWSVLIGNSTVPSDSIAWLHLNNQAGGVGGGDVYVGGSLSADTRMSLTASVGEVLSSNLLMQRLSANILEDLSVDTQNDLEAEI